MAPDESPSADLGRIPDVRAGDTVVIPPGVTHRLVNTGPDPLVLLCCCAPAYSHEDTFFE